MIKVLYFARFREQLDCQQEDFNFSKGMTVDLLMTRLAERGGAWSEVFSRKQPVLVALNQEIVRPETVLNDNDEVAFFPPVTGG